jgi:hypothetical protein
MYVAKQSFIAKQNVCSRMIRVLDLRFVLWGLSIVFYDVSSESYNRILFVVQRPKICAEIPQLRDDPLRCPVSSARLIPTNRPRAASTNH